MKRQTLLAGKTFRLNSAHRKQFKNEHGVDAEYIKFEHTIIGNSIFFCLLSTKNVLLWDGKTTVPDEIRGLFQDCSETQLNYKVKKEDNMMKNISAMMKKVMSPATRALVELGYFDDSLRLTEKGTDWLLAELFSVHQKELEKVAVDELAEKKKKKKNK